jgi:hypothetical protein
MFNDIIQLLLVLFLFIIIYNIFNYLFPLREGICWSRRCRRRRRRRRRQREEAARAAAAAKLAAENARTNQQNETKTTMESQAPDVITQGFTNIEGFNKALTKELNKINPEYRDIHSRNQAYYDKDHRYGGSWDNWKSFTQTKITTQGMEKLKIRRNKIIDEINNSIKNKTTPEGYKIGQEYWKYIDLLENTELKKELESMVTNTDIKDSRFKIDYKNKLEGFLKNAYEENRKKEMNTYIQGEGSIEVIGDYFTNFTEGFDSSALSYPDDLGQYSEVYMMNDKMQMDQLNKIKTNYNISEEDAKKRYYDTSLSYLEDWHQKLGELTKQKAIAGTQIKLGGGA